MAGIQANPSGTATNPSKLDLNILSATKALDNPTKASISKHVVALGGAKHIQTVYKRLKLKDYLRAEIQSVRDNNREYLDRIIVPDALKVTRKAIRNKDLTEKEKLPYVKLAMDKSFGETHHHTAPQQVNIKNIESIQVAISNDVGVAPVLQEDK